MPPRKLSDVTERERASCRCLPPGGARSAVGDGGAVDLCPRRRVGRAALVVSSLRETLAARRPPEPPGGRDLYH